tara:strand:- start:290 stop:451 length:162 start_codon:yes stop_codon:yes gene_type:complete
MRFRTLEELDSENQKMLVSMQETIDILDLKIKAIKQKEKSDQFHETVNRKLRK